jgi:hypothetical protein
MVHGRPCDRQRIAANPGSITPKQIVAVVERARQSMAAAQGRMKQAADARRLAMAEQAYLAAASLTSRPEPIAARAEPTVSRAEPTVSRAEPIVSRAEPVEAAPQPASRFAGLGFVDEADTGSFDLDSALQRRRVG